MSSTRHASCFCCSGICSYLRNPSIDVSWSVLNNFLRNACIKHFCCCISPKWMIAFLSSDSSLCTHWLCHIAQSVLSYCYSCIPWFSWVRRYFVHRLQIENVFFNSTLRQLAEKRDHLATDIIFDYAYKEKEGTESFTMFFKALKSDSFNPEIHQFKHSEWCTNPSRVSTFIWKKFFTVKWSLFSSTITTWYISSALLLRYWWTTFIGKEIWLMPPARFLKLFSV